MKDSVAIWLEALALFKSFLAAGRDLNEIRMLGDCLSSCAYSKQVYDREQKKPEQPRDCQ